MTGITGRRGGTARKIGRGVLDGLSALGTALADGPKLTRVREIDEQVKNLLQERDHLIVGLTQAYEGFEVSENYDPAWRKPSDEDDDDLPSSSTGRLTHCDGRKIGELYGVHPACPYKGSIHTSHEFTAND